MERRRDERISVSLKAALLHDEAMPKGCRVRDFSRRGMLLQYDYDANSATFHHDDRVTVRLSLRQADDREIVTLPATVRRIEPNGIGVEFLQPEPRLLELLEACRLDSHRTPQIAQEGNGPQTTHAEGGSSVTSFASRYRSRATGIAGRARRLATAPAAAAPGVSHAGQSDAASAARGPRMGGGESNRMLFYVGLLSLVFAAAILVFDFADTAAMKQRLNTLEATASDHASRLGEIRGKFSVADRRDSELDDLSSRMDALAGSLAALEGRLSSTVARRQSGAGSAQPTPVANGPGGAEAEQRSELAAAETLEPLRPLALPTTSGEPQADGGQPWLINLVSSHDKAAAERFVARARAQGIPVEQNRVTVKGKDVWRLQVTGFASESEARAYGAIASEKLGLKDVWVFRR